MKVFIGGSKNISVLPDSVLRQIDEYRKAGCSFLIGDCYGVDLCAQKYLSDCKERKVTIYCSGEVPRNNVGNWDVISLRNKDREGYEFYRLKDIRMAQNADCGYMIWDGISKGTRQNIEDLKAIDKLVKVEIVTKK